MYIGRPGLTNPCFDLLSNIVRFNRGVLTNDLFATFDFTMPVIPKLLSLKEDVKVEEKQRKVIRSKFLQFFFTFIEYSSATVRRDLILQKKVIGAWFKHIVYDDADTLLRMVEILENKVLREPSFLKTTKLSLFNDWSISLMSRLLSRNDAPEQKPEVTVGSFILDFLNLLTTNVTYGIRFPDKVWYSPDFVLESQDSSSRVANVSLLALLKSLKPWENMQRQALVLNILSSCPELVAPYFTEDLYISLDPKLTVFWVSQVLFLSKSIRAPIPNELIESTYKEPPSAEIMIEHILPKILTKSALAKSLLNDRQLIILNACQLMIFIFEKFSSVLELYKIKGWSSHSYLLQEKLMDRIPDIQTISSAISKIQNFEEQKMLKTIMIKVVYLYSKILPDTLVKSKFTMPKKLTSSLDKVDMDGLELVDLGNVLEIQAKLGSTGKWWNRAPDLPFSLFTILLRLGTHLDNDLYTKQIINLLEYLSKSTLLFREHNVVSPLIVMVYSLKNEIKNLDEQQEAKLWKLFDISLGKCLNSPYKYLDKLSKLQKNRKIATVSPFISILIEQWKYVDKQAPFTNLEKWFKIYLRNAIISGEDAIIIEQLAKESELPFADEFDALVSNSVSTIGHNWKSDGESLSEKLITLDSEKLIKSKKIFITSSLDLVFLRYRLLKETNPDAIEWLFSLLETTPHTLHATIMDIEFWSPLLKTSNLSISTGFLDLAHLLLSPNKSVPATLVSAVSDIFSQNISLQDRSLLLECFTWGLDKNSILSQIEIFISQKKDFDIHRAFEKYLELSVTEILEEETIYRFVEYAVKSTASDTILSSIKQYIDNAPPGLDVSTRLIEKINKIAIEDATYSRLISSLVKRISGINPSVIANFAKSKLVDDYTFISIVKSYINDNSSSKIELKELANSSSALVTKIILKMEHSDLLKVGISLATDLLDFEDNFEDSRLVNTVIEFVSKSNGSEALYSETVQLVGKLFSYDISEDSLSAKAIRIWSQRCIIWLNKRLAEDEYISDKTNEFITALTSIINQYKLNLWKVIPTDPLNTLLEISSQKYLDNLSILKLLGSVILPNKISGKNIEFTKLLQLILNNPKLPLLMELDKDLKSAEGSGLILAYIIYTLFNVDVSKHSNKGVQDKVLPICMGTQRPQDLLLIDILRKIESRTSTSFVNSIYSYVFSATAADLFEQQSHTAGGSGENYKNVLLENAPTNSISPLITFNKEGFEVTLDTYIIQNTINNFDPSVQFGPYLNSLPHLGSFEERIQSLKEYSLLLRSEFTYDIEFFLLLVASSNLIKDSKFVDLKTLVETGSVGIIFCAIAYPKMIKTSPDGNNLVTCENSISEIGLKLLATCAASLEFSKYREQDVLNVMILKTFNALGLNDPQNTYQLPTCVAVFLSNILDIAINPGHFLYLRIISQFVLRGPSIHIRDIPMFNELSNSASILDTDMQGKELVWLVDTLLAGLVTQNDVNMYLKEGVFEWLFNIVSIIPLAKRELTGHAKQQNSFYISNNAYIKEQTIKIVKRVQEIQGGSASLLVRSGLVSWVQEEHDANAEKLEFSKLGVTTVLTVPQEKAKSWLNSEDLRVPIMGFAFE